MQCKDFSVCNFVGVHVLQKQFHWFTWVQLREALSLKKYSIIYARKSILHKVYRDNVYRAGNFESTPS